MAAYRFRLHADAWRGVIVALALALLVLLGFYVIAIGRTWQLPRPTQATAPPLRQRPEDSSPRGIPADDGRNSPRAPGGAGAAPPVATATNAPDALRQLLRGYRADPTSTATASIGSSGKVKLKPGGPLTTMDGLPAEALRDAALVSGAPPRH